MMMMMMMMVMSEHDKPRYNQYSNHGNSSGSPPVAMKHVNCMVKISIANLD